MINFKKLGIVSAVSLGIAAYLVLTHYMAVKLAATTETILGSGHYFFASITAFHMFAVIGLICFALVFVWLWLCWLVLWIQDKPTKHIM